MTKRKRRWPQIGDQVVLPDGYGTVATVVDVNGWTSVHVMVEFRAYPEQEEPTITTYNLEELTPAEAA